MKKAIYILILASSLLGSVVVIPQDINAANGKFSQTDGNGMAHYGASFTAPGNDGASHEYVVQYADVKSTPKNFNDDVLERITQDGKAVSIPVDTPKDGVKDRAVIDANIKNGYAKYAAVDAGSTYVAPGDAKAKETEADKKAVEAARKRAADEKKSKGEIVLPPCIEYSVGVPTGVNIEGCLAQLSYRFLQIASFFLWAAGWFFNFTLSYSLNMGVFLEQIPIVDIGWKIFRDVANLCFIFILLYVAITTILQSDTKNAKSLLTRVIVVAVLLNFSLFFVKVVIDSSNIFALQFYGKMGGTNVESLLEGESDGDRDTGIAQTFLKGLALSSIYENAQSGEIEPITTGGNLLAVTLGGSALILVTAFVFLAGAIMFIIRTVSLVFIMVLAPLALLASILPKTESYFKTWIGYLFSQSFFASLYMMLIYLVIAIVSGEYGASTTIDGISENGKNLGTFLMGNGNSVGTIYTFVILIALMMGSLIVAKSLGAIGGDFARDWAGKATFGVSAWAGRHTVGRWSQNYVKSDRGKMDKDGNIFQRARYNLNNSVAKGSMDFRGSALGGTIAGGKVGSLGKVGGEGGFQKYSEEVKKRETDLAKTMAVQNKKLALKDALGRKDNDTGKVAAVQSALNDFTDAEYAELDAGTLSNPMVVQNSRHSQILAATDAKNEKLNESQKNQIRTMRRAELENSLKDVPGKFNGKTARSVGDVLEEMDDKEKASLPINLLKDPKVFRHLSKGVQDKIGDRTDLTPTQQKEIGKARQDELLRVSSIAGIVHNDPNDKLIAGIMKGMSAKGLIKLHNDEADSGRQFLDKPTIAKYITGTQLKDMAELGTVQNPASIGAAVRALGTDAVGHQYMRKPANAQQWR